MSRVVSGPPQLASTLSVTQATSKSTGVTLNAPAGQITMNGAALAGGAETAFAVTNDRVLATDVVVVAMAGGAADASTYVAGVSAVADGSFQIYLENISAGSLSEAVVLNFIILRAAF